MSGTKTKNAALGRGVLGQLSNVAERTGTDHAATHPRPSHPSAGLTRCVDVEQGPEGVGPDESVAPVWNASTALLLGAARTMLAHRPRGFVAAPLPLTTLAVGGLALATLAVVVMGAAWLNDARRDLDRCEGQLQASTVVMPAVDVRVAR